MKKCLKILYTIIACAVMPFVFCACQNKGDEIIKVSKISLNKDEITLVMDGDKSSTDEFVVSYEPANANQLDIEFAQYDKNLIEITQKRNSSDTFVVKAKALEEESRSTIVVVRMKGNVDVSCKLFVEVTRKALSTLSTPTNVHYNEELNRVEWDICPQTEEQGFNGYIAKINGEDYVTGANKNYITLSEEKFGKGVQNQIEVKAISQIDDYDSAFSAPYKFLILDDIKNLSHENGVVSWDSVVGAIGYQYKVNVQKPVMLTKDTLQYIQTFDQKGEYEIEVTAIASNIVDENDNVICNCFGSSSAKITITKLSAPENFQYKNLFTWDTVENADSYEIYEVKDDNTEVLLGNLNNISYKLDRNISVGAHKYKVRAIGNGKTTITSDFSALKTVNKLATPTNLRVEDGVITWDKDPNAMTYQISFCGYYDGHKYYDEFYETSRDENAFFYIDQPDESENKITFKFGEKFMGDYYVRVASVSDAENTVDSNWTEEIFASKLIAPDKATFGVEDNKITWQAVEHASAYEIVLNIAGEERIDKVYTNYYNVPQDIAKGELSFQIRSLGNTASGDSGKYLNSDLSSVAYAQKLEAPVLSIYNGVLVWSAVKNSSRYILNINNVDYDMGKQTSFDFAGLEAKDYNIKIKAVGGNASTIGANNLIGSFESSYSVVRSVSKLSAPVLSMVEGEIDSSSPDENADIRFNPDVRNQDGSITVSAYSQGFSSNLEGEKGFITSDLSNTLTYFIAPIPTNLKVENGILIWDELESKYQGAFFKLQVNAQVEDVEYNQEYEFKNNSHSLDFSTSSSGSYYATLKVIGTSSGTTGNLVKTSGEVSISFVILPKPELKVSTVEEVLNTQRLDNLSGILYWEKVGINGQYAVGYNLSIKSGKTTKTYDLGSATTFNLPDVAGKYKISLQAYGDGGLTVDGQYSDEIEFEKLKSPSNVKIDNDGLISWSSDYTGSLINIRAGFYIELNGEKYLPYDIEKLNGQSATDIGNYIVSTKSVDLNKLYDGNSHNFIEGQYKLRIVTLPLNMTFEVPVLGTIGHTTDLISNPSEYLTFIKLEQPYGLKVDRNSDGHYIVNWTKSLHQYASGYEILIKDATNSEDEGVKVKITDVNTTSYDFTQYLQTLTEQSSNYVVSVRVLSTTNNVVSSEYGEEVSIKIVDNINLSIREGKLAWSKVEGVQSYDFEFSINGNRFNKILPASATSYALTLANDDRFTAGEYSIKVKVIADATSNDGNVIYVDNFDYFDCGTFVKLATPQNINVKNGKIVFTSLDTPDYFNLYMTGKTKAILKLDLDIKNGSLATYELDERYGAGIYSFTVQAMGDSNFLSSEVSEPITPQEVEKLEYTSIYIKDGILNWNYIENSNGFEVELSGAKFYVYDSSSGEYSEEATGDAFSIKVEGGMTALNISNELTSIDGRKFKLEAGQYSVRIKSLGTDLTYLNSNFTPKYTFKKLKQVENVRIEDGKLMWDKVSSLDAPNKIALYIKFDGDSEYRKPVILASDVNSFDFAGINYPAQSGYSAYLQLIGDTKLSVSDTKLGNICGTPSNEVKAIEKLVAPTDLKVSQNDSQISEEENPDKIGILTFKAHPKFSGDEDKYLLSVMVRNGDKETVLDDIILKTNEYDLTSENLNNIELVSGLEIVFQVKYLGLNDYISSDFSETLTIIIPQSPVVSVIIDEQNSFTGKITWEEVKLGDFETKYLIEYKYLPNDTLENDLLKEETWQNAQTSETITDKLYSYVFNSGYYIFKVKSLLQVGNSTIISPDMGYTNIYRYNLFSGGVGTEESPFEVYNITTFNYIRYNVTAHYKLTGDIDFKNSVIYNIGSEEEKFTGSFDGCNFVLKNITLFDIAENSSIFDYVGTTGVIKNVMVQNIVINNGSKVGGMVGVSEGLIYNVKVGAVAKQVVDEELSTEDEAVYKIIYEYDGISSISPRSTLRQIVSCGGIVGLNKGTVTNCDNYAVVAPRNDNEEVRSGGIAGENVGTVEYSYNHNNVGGVSVDEIYSNMSGGVVGFNNGSLAKIINCGNFGNVFAHSRNENAISQGAYAGGICAYNNSGIITNCFNDNSNGLEQSEVLASTQIFAKTVFSKMDIFVGGLVGYNENNSQIQTSYSISNIQFDLGNTSANANLGGIVGLNDAKYMNLGLGLRCYALYDSTVTSAGESFQANANVYAYTSDKLSDFITSVKTALRVETLCEVKYK